MANTDNLKPFQPGQSGNPAGMKPGTRHYATLLRKALEEGVEVEINKKKITVNDAYVMKQVAKGVAKGSARMIELVFDRIDGKATQAIEHSGSIGNGDLSSYSEEELLARLAELESDGSTAN